MECLNCKKELSGKQTKFCCPECKRAYYSKTKAYNTKYSQKKDYHGIVLKYALIQKRGGACECCGYNKSISALEFHHIDPSTKKFTLDARTLERTSDEEILKEFSKCKVLCANCHSELHHPGLKMDNINNIKKECKNIKYRKLHLGLISDIY